LKTCCSLTPDSPDGVRCVKGGFLLDITKGIWYKKRKTERWKGEREREEGREI